MRSSDSGSLSSTDRLESVLWEPPAGGVDHTANAITGTRLRTRTDLRILPPLGLLGSPCDPVTGTYSLGRRLYTGFARDARTGASLTDRLSRRPSVGLLMAGLGRPSRRD